MSEIQVHPDQSGAIRVKFLVPGSGSVQDKFRVGSGKVPGRSGLMSALSAPFQSIVREESTCTNVNK